MSVRPSRADIGRQYLDAAYEYADDVRSGKEVAGKYVKLAVDRWFRDMEHGGERGLYFDENAAARLFRFTNYCRHSKGKWKGTPLTLSPWQCFIDVNIFGWMRKDGNRRYRTAYEEIARKNGKTTKHARTAIYGLVADNESGAEIYSAATKREQSRLMFEEAIRMIKQSPALKNQLEVLRLNINHPASFSKFEPLSKDAKSMDGLNIHFGLPDEFHAHQTSEIWNVLKSGQGSREQPLLWAITTAGFNINGICHNVRDYAAKVLEGIIEDDSFFAIIYTIDEGDDWRDEVAWKKANPNLGVSLSLEYLRDQCKQAQEIPSELNNFKTKHLNMWVTAESAWMDPDKWNALKAEYTIDDLIGLACYGGLDLASISDICSLAFIFKSPESKPRIYCRHYLPEETVKVRVEKNNVPYDQWAREGWLTLTPGNVTDYNFIKKDIFDFMKHMDVQGIAFDRWNSSQMVNDLTDEGVPMLGFGQGFTSMNAPMKELERLVLSQEIEHNGDPVLSWAISNVVAKTDPAGNIKPAKDKSKEKIDPAVALIEAVGLAMDTEQIGSIYDKEDRGITVF